MNPLDRFEYSQSSLQDYIDCKRRFQLRYLQRVAWPAIQAEPARENEQHIQRGERFHRLAQQYLIGVPEDRLTRMAETDPDPRLPRWWQNFLANLPAALEGAERFVETALETRLGGFRLVAKYDLVLLRPDGRAVIYDWKTGEKRPPRERLLQRMQTRVYPYLLVQAGAALTRGRALRPDQVEMIYWFTEPDLPAERLSYSAAQFERDGEDLRALLVEIQSLGPDDFPKAATSQPCAFCVYRSLCDRGVSAGLFAEMEEAPETGAEIEINFDQIGEISF